MFGDLFWLSIFFVANILSTLVLLAYAWLYLDAYRLDKKGYDLYRAIGAIFTALGFLFAILGKGINELTILAQFVGIVLIFIGSFREPIPGLPASGAEPRRFNVVSPIVVIGALFTFVFSALIAYRTREKVKRGLSKQFSLLSIFWVVFTFYFFIQFLTFVGENYFVAIDTVTRQYSFFWILNQILLIAASVVLFRWICQFISFRLFPSIFLNIWQGAIYLTVILATGYSVFTISQSEAQIFDLLNKNARLVEFNMNQIKDNNNDLLEILVDNPQLVLAYADKNISGIVTELETVLSTNSNLDKIVAVDRNANLIYDSENPDLLSKSLSDHKLISEVLKTGISKYEFISEVNEASGDKLSYEFVAPIVNGNGEIIGAINLIKKFNNSFLDYIKKQTSLEVILYVNDMRSASTILENDNLSRVERVPFENNGELFNKEGNIRFLKTRFQTVPYYASIIDIKDPDGKVVGNLIIATPQSVLLNAIQNALMYTFVMTLILLAVASIPTWYLAKSIKINSAA